MDEHARLPSPRRAELLERAYAYVLAHGLAAMSLRPLATAIDSSPRVLLLLFGSKDGLVRALLQRARVEELGLLDELRQDRSDADIATAAARVWTWLSEPEHRDLARLWVEGYARALVEPTGPWAGFAARTVDDWLGVLAGFQPAALRSTVEGSSQRTAVLALLRGCLLDLLATGDRERTTAAVKQQLRAL